MEVKSRWSERLKEAISYLYLQSFQKVQILTNMRLLQFFVDELRLFSCFVDEIMVFVEYMSEYLSDGDEK